MDEVLEHALQSKEGKEWVDIVGNSVHCYRDNTSASQQIYPIFWQKRLYRRCTIIE